MRSRRYGTGAFKTSFDAPSGLDERERIRQLPAAERLAETMAQRWYDHDTKTFSINCNQEPCYEELCMQQVLGFKNGELRLAAMRRRRELNGGFTPFTPETVKAAVLEACTFMDKHREQFAPLVSAWTAIESIGVPK